MKLWPFLRSMKKGLQSSGVCFSQKGQIVNRNPYANSTTESLIEAEARLERVRDQLSTLDEHDSSRINVQRKLDFVSDELAYRGVPVLVKAGCECDYCGGEIL